MRLRLSFLFLACWFLPVQATDYWRFDKRIAVTGSARVGVFHHLEGAGRRHIAFSSGHVAIAWEDDHSGDPQVYVAMQSKADSAFAAPLQLSLGDEAYEPAIAALTDGRFVLVWEQDAGIHAAIVSAQKGIEARRQLTSEEASNATIATHKGKIYAAWRERRQGLWWLQVASLTADQSALSLEWLTPVEKSGLSTPVLFPALAANADGLCLTWEDRRKGNTRILTSYLTAGATEFSVPGELNEVSENRTEYDRGNGATRVSIDTVGSDEFIAAWMDKRRPGSIGYGIFAAFGSEGGASFGPNEKVHGHPGDIEPHYNPAVAGNISGQFVIAWDDYRHGTLDIWLSHYDENFEWTADFSPAVASGPGEQSHAAVVLDAENRLHLVWVERQASNEPTRIWYALGIPRNP